ncbi:hypothetical protein PUN4_340276 [Paraburkholderia unamae]|nr:hypothetical protein PUN4_340276 [Paraburkholderia unamae]
MLRAGCRDVGDAALPKRHRQVSCRFDLQLASQQPVRRQRSAVPVVAVVPRGGHVSFRPVTQYVPPRGATVHTCDTGERTPARSPAHARAARLARTPAPPLAMHDEFTANTHGPAIPA